MGTSSDNLLTPSAVQLVFSAQGMKALNDDVSSTSTVGDYTKPAKACADDSSCSAYQFKCSDSDPYCQDRFPKVQVTYSLTTVPDAMGQLQMQNQYMVFVKTKPQPLKLSVEAHGLIV